MILELYELKNKKKKTKTKEKIDLTRTSKYGIILANKIEKDFVAGLERSPTKFVKIHKTVLIFDN